MFTFGSAPKRHGNDQIEEQEEVPEDRYEVVHDKVAVRSSADTKAPVVSAMMQGKFVTGERKQIDGVPWLRLSKEACASLALDAEHTWTEKGLKHVQGEEYGHPKVGDKFTKAHLAKAQEKSSINLDDIVQMEFVARKEPEAWVLIDGKSVGLGQLLKEAPLQKSLDVTEDIVRWAKETSGVAKRDEEELRSLLKVAKKQVDALRPALQSAAALAELKQAKLLGDNDVSRGEDAIAKCILEKLLLKRLGEPTGLAFAHWEEDRFDAYVQETVLPLAPYRCRSFTPTRVKRVLVLLHGALVTGDDLVAEAEVLQRLLPETAVVLPEAPCLLDAELGLRSWWPSSEARAPAAAVRRLVATVHWVLRRSGSAALILGGFSQGSQLLVQGLGALRRDGVNVRGLVVLSGLLEPFEAAAGMKCLVVHGGKDEKVPLDLARSAVRQMQERSGGAELKYLEIAELAHEISDDELERIAAFCDEAAPTTEEGKASSAEKRAQDAEQAKLLRYVRRMADGLQMYDKEWFMVHICDLKMIGLGPESPALGGGTLRYHLHDAGPDSNGLVVLFHGLVSNLRKETDPLALAYLKALQVSVVVVDYRQRTSSLNIDAQMCLEELDTLSGSSTKPVVIHGIGLGATLAIHMAMASQVMPPEVSQRLRLLVLDGAMGAIHMNVGCTTKDPIGNDSKLAYVRMPLCVLGGDDRLCGLTVGETQWNQVSTLAEDLRRTDKISALTLIPDVALKNEGKERSLHPQLFRAVDAALSARGGATKEQGKDFIEDVLNVSEEFAGDAPQGAVTSPWVPKQGTSPKEQLEAMGQSMMEAASGSRKASLSDAQALQEPRRSEELLGIMLAVAGPLLRAHGGFKGGVEGLRQFEAALSTVSEFFPDLQQLHLKIDKTYDFGVLRRMDEATVAKMSKNGAGQEESASELDAGGVKVVVKHLTKGGSLTLGVPDTATILDVRHALMEKLKESSLNKVKLVVQAAKGTKMIPDGELLNGRTELLMVGRPLE